MKGIITARRAGWFSRGVELIQDMDIPPRTQKSDTRIGYYSKKYKSGCLFIKTSEGA